MRDFTSNQGRCLAVPKEGTIEAAPQTALIDGKSLSIIDELKSSLHRKHAILALIDAELVQAGSEEFESSPLALLNAPGQSARIFADVFSQVFAEEGHPPEQFLGRGQMQPGDCRLLSALKVAVM